MLSILGCYAVQYDLKLVGLAAFICIIAAVTTVNLLSRAQLASGNDKLIWLGAAAAVLGGGVWSLHFVAMLAFMPGMQISYNIAHTVGSIAIAVGSAAFCFLIRELVGRRTVGAVLGGIVLGAGIAGMHYEGVFAMQVPGQLILTPIRVILSVAVGMAFSILALARALDLRNWRRKVEVSVYICLAVIGLHFVGMSAVQILPGLGADAGGAVLGSDSLAAAVGSISIAIIITGMICALTDQRLANLAQWEAQRLRQLADASFEGIIIHQDGIISDANETFAAMIGRQVGDLIGQSALDFVAEKDLPKIRYLLGKSGDGGRIEFDVQTPDGRCVPVEVLSRKMEYRGHSVLVSAVRDLSERKRIEEKIHYLAHHDTLTGLCNRALLSDRLMQMIAQATRAGEKLAVLYLDLDRFKPVNDLLGHEGGDTLLVAVAQRLKLILRETDTIARVGGDEFVIVQAIGTQANVAESSAKRIIKELTTPFMIGGQEVVIGVSVGVALFPADGGTPAVLLRNADKAMYRAKHELPGTYRIYTPEIGHRLDRLRALEHDLRHAIPRNELELYYQPIFDGQAAIIGLEALLRWRHPQRGIISPVEFIPVAEESGLIFELGNWVLETACRAAMTWPKEWRIAVNVSPTQFSRRDFIENVVTVLARSGLPADRLELEVTESLLIGETARVLPLLKSLRQLGVHISLDDFGTGYSSLSYLHQFPFEKLKIDRSFITELGLTKDSEKIVGAIVALGHSLKMTVTAEGVETEAQACVLRRLDCDQMQGFLWARPMPKAEIDLLAVSAAQGLAISLRKENISNSNTPRCATLALAEC